jgi:serine/threonine protein kinase
MLRTFGPYRVLRKLGEGGMAEVFLAEREREGGFKRRVALKRIHPRFKKNPVLLERFLTEARTQARFSHANVVKILDFGVEPEPYLVLEYVDGISAGQLVHRMYEIRQRLDPSAAMYIAIYAAKALDHAHKLKDEDGTPLGIVHRDLTPANVLVSAEGTTYVTDFGLVQVADNILETYGAVPVGTYCYMAPEQLAGGHVDARADLFSLGIVLWEMLATRQLLPTNDPDEVRKIYAEKTPPAPSKLNPEVPDQLDELTMQLLRIDPDERPPSAEAVSVALQRMAHERAPGYGSEQLAKTLRWAFPERAWNREPAAQPAAQPSPAERAKLSTRTPTALSLRARAAREWLRTNGFAVVTIAILLFFTALVSFVAGLLVAGIG